MDSVTLRKYNLEKEIFDSINRSGIPICFVGDILKNILTQVLNAARKELEDELKKVSGNNEKNDRRSIPE